jgi:hypothetical protein
MSALSSRHLRGLASVGIFVSACIGIAAGAQAILPVALETTSGASSSAATVFPELVSAAPNLPDAPGLPDAHGRAITSGPVVSMPQATPTQKYIAPGQAAPSLTANDKVLLGLRDAFSPFAASGWFASAGYEQLLNGSPNYGTDRGAFGERLGSSAIRDASEGIFTDSVMSPLLREDPRYYRLGPAHNFFARLVYAGTRPLITRTDGGRLSPNLALLSGTLGGAALTNLYYPQVNRGPTQTMETFGTSIGGSALGDVVSEFYADLMQRIHPQRR